MSHTPPPTPRLPMPRAAALIAALFIASSLAGCADALRERYEAQPRGAFAERQLSTLARPAPTVSPPAPAPDMTRDAASDGAEGPQAPADAADPDAADPDAADPDAAAPTRAQTLRALGLDDVAADLTPLRAADWRPDALLTRAQARQAFLARDPEVTAIIQRHRASRTRYGQVAHLNDLARQYDAFAEGLRTEATTPHALPQRPSWPLRGAGRVQSALVDADVALSRARSTSALLDALSRFEAAYQEALFRRELVDVLSDRARQARRAADAVQTLYRGGAAPYSSVLLAQARREALEARLASARERALAERRQLAAALDLDPDALVDVDLTLEDASPVLPERAALPEAVRTRSPAVNEAEAVATRAALMIELVERQILPELSPGLSHSRTGAPLPTSAARGAMYATRAPFLLELRLTQEAAEAALAHAHRLLPARADVQWAALSDALRRWRLLSGAQRRRARQARDAATDAYRTGRLSFGELDAVLDADLQTGLEALEARRDAFLAAARLQTLTGPTKGEEKQTP